MTSAPTLSNVSATTAVLTFTSPPSMPLGLTPRLQRDEPVMKVLAALAKRFLLALVGTGDVSSRDVEMWIRTLLMP